MSERNELPGFALQRVPLGIGGVVAVGQSRYVISVRPEVIRRPFVRGPAPGRRGQTHAPRLLRRRRAEARRLPETGQ